MGLNRVSIFFCGVMVALGCGLTPGKAQDVPMKPGWEKEAEALRETGQTKDGDKAGLGGKEQLSRFEQILVERLNLSEAQRARIHAILLDHGSRVASAAPSRKKLHDESGEEYKTLKRQAEEAKQARDKEQLRSIMQRLSELRSRQLMVRGEAQADHSALLTALEKELTRQQTEELYKIAEEFGMIADKDVGAKLLPKEFISIITGPMLKLNDEQRKQIIAIYKKTQEEARPIAGDKGKLDALLAKMRADVRNVLDAHQRRLAAMLLAKAEARQAERSDAVPQAADADKDKTTTAAEQTVLLEDLKEPKTRKQKENSKGDRKERKSSPQPPSSSAPVPEERSDGP